MTTVANTIMMGMGLMGDRSYPTQISHIQLEAKLEGRCAILDSKVEGALPFTTGQELDDLVKFIEEEHPLFVGEGGGGGINHI